MNLNTPIQVKHLLTILLIFIFLNVIGIIHLRYTVNKYHRVIADSHIYQIAERFGPVGGDLDALNWVKAGDPKILIDFKVAFILRNCETFSRDQVDRLYHIHTMSNGEVQPISTARVWLESLASDPCSEINEYLRVNEIKT